MDSIVDYLIVLFFIVSFLASVFKKKKKQAEKEGKIKQQPIVDLRRDDVKKNKAIAKKSTTVNKNSFEDILKTMLQVPEPIKEKKSEVDTYYEEAMKYSEMASTKQEALIPSSNESHGEKLATEKSKNYAETMKEVKRTHSSQKALEIKESLHNINTIKDYMIMNEILGKPVALKE